MDWSKNLEKQGLSIERKIVKDTLLHIAVLTAIIFVLFVLYISWKCCQKLSKYFSKSDPAENEFGKQDVELARQHGEECKGKGEI